MRLSSFSPLSRILQFGKNKNDAVHVTVEQKQWVVAHRVPVQCHQLDQILFPGQKFGLEPVQGRAQRRAPVPYPLRTDQSERRVDCESFSVVEVLVARQATVDLRLSVLGADHQSGR